MLVKYKHATGALHIGGGRFFYAGETYPVSEEEWENLQWFEDLEEVQEDDTSRQQVPLDKHTVDELRFMAKEAGIEVTASMKKADIVAALTEVMSHNNSGEGQAAE
ncbi:MULTISPECIES: Rho termination factor N-terminal domain-containing protein [Bacillales]|uniref:Rho termination factor N-terminal domain-containing protein n=1 Tax=Bacillales TaxID=1385 RepID=UPI0003493A31|nr:MULTISPECIES: Rho termination factor N-terminal domain-containing protein [Bacillales]KMZ42516.1 hypothetical protein AC624_16070 [Bacillus sp. FJAT-27238]